MTEQKNYYAIIPADVRYDKTLTANAKLLYGEITALCNEKGFCWASNNYFAELYSVKPQAISKWIKQLESCEYVNVEYTRKGKEIVQRMVSINVNTYQQKDNKVSTKTYEGINKNVVGYQQKRKENTTVNIKDNNIINNKESDMLKEFDLFWDAYPKHENKKKSKEKYVTLYKKKALPDINMHVNIINNWKDTDKWKRGFISNPATWLHNELWNDDIPTKQRTQSKPDKIDYTEGW